LQHGHKRCAARPACYPGISVLSAVNIFLDESGSFVNAASQNSWNCIAAYLTPEVDRKRLREALASLKRAAGASVAREIKLNNLRESDYLDFLIRLGKLNGVLFTLATDAGLNRVADIVKHQEEQAAKITEYKDRMHYERARQGLQRLSDEVRRLPPQLYVQLHCQVNLISSIVADGILYFVQRFPSTLGKFCWRIDQKNSTRTEYEKAFVALTPALLQTISLTEPILMLKGADYSAFRRFDYSEEERPTYLKTVYGIDAGSGGPALNIGKLIREDLKFEDSKENQGVQVADLLAAGVRRCLRTQFKDGRRAAQLLGGLMVQGKARCPPVRLLGFSEAEEAVSDEVSHIIRIMGRSSRAMVTR
jgi:hypothetical protein